jgi:hypothetical protein
MSPRHAWIVALPVAALMIAGCGGGGGNESSETTAVSTATTTALSKAELIEQGDAICAEVNAAVGSTGSSESASSATQVADLYSGMVASLNNLGTPRETDGYAEFSSAAEELAKAEDELKLASERGEATGLETVESNASSALASFQNAASEYGFKDCSEGPSAPATTAPGGEAEAEAGSEEAEPVEPEAVEPEVEEEAAPEVAPETGGAGGTAEGGGTAGAPEGGGATGGSSGGIGPG